MLKYPQPTQNPIVLAIPPVTPPLSTIQLSATFMTYKTSCDTSTLPAEITDVVIDQLHSDPKTLGVCGMVCSEWLIRSRYHIFSTVHLWPWRVRRFFELSHAQECTFTKYVNCIEVDDARASGGPHALEPNDIFFHEILSSSLFSRFSHIKALRIRNVDWTLLPPFEQDRLRSRLAVFVKLKSLEFDDVMFHDLREVARITALFPSLCHLVTNIQFSKYMEHTIASATSLTLPSTLKSLRLGTDDALPVLLSTNLKQLRLHGLALDGVKFWHLQYIGSALQGLGDRVRDLDISFSDRDEEWVNNSDLAHLNMVHQTRLQSLRISGVSLPNRAAPCALLSGIPPLISKIPLSGNMKKLTLGITPESNLALQSFDWTALQRTLVLHPRCFLNLDISMPCVSAGAEDEVKEYLHGQLKRLWRGRRLGVRVYSTAQSFQ